LIIDDDRELIAMLSDYLAGDGFEVTAGYDGAEALEKAAEAKPDVIVLDIMLPVYDGLEVLRSLRRDRHNIPILMLTARGDDVDTVVGLELGADDYLPKPCNPRVLVARLRALLRRTQNEPATLPEQLQVGDLYLDLGRRQASLDHCGAGAAEEVDLTDAEIDILACLMRRAGQAVDKDRLSREALNRPLMPYDRSIDWHISNLRRKLGQFDNASERIKTVRGVGYQYVSGASGQGQDHDQ
jgi:two-component system response regulator CpxR